MKEYQIKKLKSSIKKGDIFQLGVHRLACGDAKDPELIKRLVEQDRIKSVITDVPYSVDYIQSKKGFSKVKADKHIVNDEFMTEEKYAEFTKNWIAPLLPYLEDKNNFYIFNSDKMIFALRKGMIEAGLYFSQLLIWIKSHSVIGRKDYLPQHELIAYGWYGKHEFMKSKDKSVLFCPKPNKSPLHPTMKPLSLIRRLILNSTKINEVVYDSFGGSGTTLISAEQTKRKCLMIEIDADYCQTIIERWEKLTGKKAKLL